jgi:hypothetical protein
VSHPPFTKDKLIGAAATGDVEVLQAWLTLPSIEHRPSWCSGLLEVACREGQEAVVSLLLPHAALNNPYGTPLLVASLHNHPGVVKLLLPHVDPKIRGSMALQEALTHGHVEVARLLLPVSDTTGWDGQVLNLLSQRGQLELVDLLLPWMAPSDEVGRALVTAARHHHCLVVERLLAHPSSRGHTSEAMAQAAMNSQEDMLRLLAPHCSALEAACWVCVRFQWCTESVEKLLPYFSPEQAEPFLRFLREDERVSQRPASWLVSVEGAALRHFSQRLDPATVAPPRQRL